MTTEISCGRYGTTKAGEVIDRYVLKNSNGMEVGIITYGGIITSLRVPDRNGDVDDVVLGYDSLVEYENCTVHFGCITGRYANRISNGSFTIDGQTHQLETNRGAHHLHGASAGFGKVVWRAEEATETGGVAVVLRYLSVDGHGGYPGNLRVEVIYRLSDSNQLDIEYRAATDKPSIINLTNHSYFNLHGHQHAITNGVLDHELCLSASNFVPTDELGIPLGEIWPVDNTPLDFRQSTTIGKRIHDQHVQLANGKGYDHNWVADGPAGELSRVARVHEPVTGRIMDVETTQPGVQFYSGNNLSDRTGKGDVCYGYRGSLCLETQHFPDAPNNADFPEAVVRPDIPWLERARFTFSHR